MAKAEKGPYSFNDPNLRAAPKVDTESCPFRQTPLSLYRQREWIRKFTAIEKGKDCSPETAHPIVHLQPIDTADIAKDALILVVSLISSVCDMNAELKVGGNWQIRYLERGVCRYLTDLEGPEGRDGNTEDPGTDPWILYSADC
jgi:hypothetical protein